MIMEKILTPVIYIVHVYQPQFLKILFLFQDNREYFCSAVDGTPLVVGFVMSRKKTALFLNVTTKKPRKFESNLVGYFLTDQ